MKAAILTQTRAPLEIAELRMPERLSFGQVHVRIHYSGICGAQLNEIEAAKGEDKFLPHLLGHEGSGTVVAVGEGVKRVKAGDRVLFGKWSGTEVKLDGEELLIMKESDIMGIIS